MINYKLHFLLISKQKKIKYKLIKIKKKAGRNNTGRITVRGRGGSNIKKKIRVIDFLRSLWNIPAIVKRYDYDNNRNTLICLISYFTGIISYIVAVENLKLGDIIYTGLRATEKISGNTILLKKFHLNTILCNLEIQPFKGSTLLRASGAFGKIIKKSLNFCLVKLKSGKIKKVNILCLATVGKILNFNFYLFKYKKAGLLRTQNKRPKVRGVAMNPVDHPYGGGEGKKSKKSICMSPWGKLIKTKKTRKNEINLKRYFFG